MRWGGLWDWVLGGALAASLALNVHLLTREVEAPPVEPVTAKTPVIPASAELLDPATDAALRDLGLTQDQVEAIHGFWSRHCRDCKRLSGEVRRCSRALGETLNCERKCDRQKVLKLVKTLTELHEELLTRRVESILKVRETLTPEQRKRLDELGSR